MAMYDTGGGYGIRTLRSGNALPEGEMDALLLGKTRVRNVLGLFLSIKY